MCPKTAFISLRLCAVLCDHQPPSVREDALCVHYASSAAMSGCHGLVNTLVISRWQGRLHRSRSVRVYLHIREVLDMLWNVLVAWGVYRHLTHAG
jgi:hypothetical protein